MKNDCPKCRHYRFPNWKKAFAFWPFKLHCGNCKSALRAKIPRWQNILVQIVGQGIFWAGVLFGLQNGLQGALAGGAIGAVLAVLIAMIPGWGAELEQVPTK